MDGQRSRGELYKAHIYYKKTHVDHPIRCVLPTSISGLVVKSIVAIDGPRVRFAADAFLPIWRLRMRSRTILKHSMTL